MKGVAEFIGGSSGAHYLGTVDSGYYATVFKTRRGWQVLLSGPKTTVVRLFTNKRAALKCARLWCRG